MCLNTGKAQFNFEILSNFNYLVSTETPPPAYSPPQDEKHGSQSPHSENAMDTGISSDVTPVPYQVTYFELLTCLMPKMNPNFEEV
jgi:hypothetical protein